MPRRTAPRSVALASARSRTKSPARQHDDAPQCRICFETTNGAGDDELIRPCPCNSYSHRGCLQTWRDMNPSTADKCPACARPYTVRRVVDPIKVVTKIMDVCFNVVTNIVTNIVDDLFNRFKLNFMIGIAFALVTFVFKVFVGVVRGIIAMGAWIVATGTGNATFSAWAYHAVGSVLSVTFIVQVGILVAPWINRWVPPRRAHQIGYLCGLATVIACELFVPDDVLMGIGMVGVVANVMREAYMGAFATATVLVNRA